MLGKVHLFISWDVGYKQKYNSIVHASLTLVLVYISLSQDRGSLKAGPFKLDLFSQRQIR